MQADDAGEAGEISIGGSGKEKVEKQRCQQIASWQKRSEGVAER